MIKLIYFFIFSSIFTSVITLDSIQFHKLTSRDDLTPQYLTQKLDHFNPLDTRTFQQQYYADGTHWTDHSGPVFVYICGEAPMGGPAGGFVSVLAEQNNALVLSLEHRYYGKSQPFTDYTTANLTWLTVEQELVDLAEFIQFYQKEITSNYGIEGNPFFIIGGSYSGALSAWFRLKFPHLVKGSLASSGVVNPVLEFVDFDLQIANSSGIECADVLREVVQKIDVELDASSERNKAVKEHFDATTVDDGSFRYYIADAMSLPVQYSKHSAVCDPMIKAKNDGSDLILAFADYCKDFFFKVMKTTAVQYSDDYMKITKTDTTGKAIAQRTWWWQKCSQLAYFQIAPQTNPIRSPKITLDWHKQKCSTVYGSGIWPNTQAIIDEFGSNEIKGTNIFFTNGANDPWQWCAVRHHLGISEQAHVIQGDEDHDSGHCIDLHTPKEDDPPDLQFARAQISTFVYQWIHA
ncbi:peptidase s28 family protein [Anaeramoeba flamelloides]|uniref:Peptidase s28 family protein n=1 Tax=Anaeramoeba flamelloides TaxID=1746091 RepID=A0AAV8A3D1_9EUKA|nr:peptidase s28 family protein [Anaeramoeba flamelloides]KAJ6243581.1 peptidase s28 family protein [Anaeramoeba flamelloides]